MACHHETRIGGNVGRHTQVLDPALPGHRTRQRVDRAVGERVRHQQHRPAGNRDGCHPRRHRKVAGHDHAVGILARCDRFNRAVRRMGDIHRAVFRDRKVVDRRCNRRDHQRLARLRIGAADLARHPVRGDEVALGIHFNGRWHAYTAHDGLRRAGLRIDGDDAVLLPQRRIQATVLTERKAIYMACILLHDPRRIAFGDIDRPDRIGLAHLAEHQASIRCPGHWVDAGHFGREHAHLAPGQFAPHFAGRRSPCQGAVGAHSHVVGIACRAGDHDLHATSLQVDLADGLAKEARGVERAIRADGKAVDPMERSARDENAGLGVRWVSPHNDRGNAKPNPRGT